MRYRAPKTPWPKAIGFAPPFVTADERGPQVRACRNMGAHRFFELTADGQEMVEAVCGRCPLLDVCLDYALSQRQLKGWWGGTSEKTRQAMRRAAREQVAA